MKSTSITTNLKVLDYISNRLEELAGKMHLDAVSAYPEEKYTALDSGGLGLRNCKLHVDQCIRIKWFEFNGFLLEDEIKRLSARTAELEDFYTKSTPEDRVDLEQALLSLYNDKLKLSAQIADLKLKSTDFSLPDHVIDILVEFNFINRNN